MTPMPGRVALKSDIKSAALATPGVRWPKAARYFAEQYGMSVAQLKRWAPWAEKLWLKETAVAREERRQRAKVVEREATGLTTLAPLSPRNTKGLDPCFSGCGGPQPVGRDPG